MLEALGARRARLVVACPAPSPRTYPAREVVEAALRLGVDAIDTDSVEGAIEVALGEAGPDDLVLITGSLYVVGAARAVLAVEGA